MNTQQMDKRIEEGRKAAFQSWMSNPMTKALMSTVPPCDHLETLLRAAFESGFGNGQACVAAELMMAMMTKKLDGDK